MRATIIRSHGGPERLEVDQLPEPEPKSNEVRIRVRACGINHLDLWVRQGWPRLGLSFPHVLGSDIAGIVDAVGSAVEDVEPGVGVLASPGLSCGVCRACLSGQDHWCRRFHILGENVWGGYAELVCVPRQNLLPTPKNLSFEEAACLPVSFLTAWEMLVRRSELRAGETVLIQAAGSGVGSAAIQIAKHLGARVIATASSEEKLAKALALGADEAVSYTRPDFSAEINKLTFRRGVDLAVDHVGASTFEESIGALAVGGRLVTCGATTGPEVPLDLRTLFWRRISLIGSSMGSKGDLFHILRLVEEGKLRPILDTTLPLKDARFGHERISERAHFGKIVLVP